MSRLEEIGRENWEEFFSAPIAVVMLGKTTCEACKAWSQELIQFLQDDEDFADVRFGKVMLDQGGLGAFKKANEWLRDVDDLPHNAIYVNGVKVKDFLGSGITRLENRLKRIKSEQSNA